MTVKERLIKYIKFKGISINKFEKTCNFSTGYVGNMRTSTQPDKVMRIAHNFPDLNTGWLLTGEGEMLNNSGNELIKNNDNTNFKLVPLYNMDAVGGCYNSEVDSREYITTYIPFVDAREDDLCIPITGNSMSPTYPSGCIVRVREIENWYEFLEMGQIYVICLNDGRRLIKELRKSEENNRENYLCVSHNPDFDPVELPKKLIVKVFMVCAMYIKTTM